MKVLLIPRNGLSSALVFSRSPSLTSTYRKDVLNSLQKITEEFVRQMGRKHKMPEKIVNSLGGKIFTYGGFRLGIFGPGSDIDTLVVTPENITREDFFQHYPNILLEEAPKDSITDLTNIADAHVPIITFDYHGISIDLNFCELNVPQVPRDMEVADDMILRGIDETGAKAINGTRVADKMMELIPQMAVFRVALKGVKLWAKQRGLYANVVGFPGGIAWAIMVARVCQLYPKATSSSILLKFFRIMGSWQWPTPVQLNQLEPGKLNLKIWNPFV